MAHIGGYAFETLIGQHQAVIDRIAAVHTGQVSGVCLKKACGVALNGIGQSEQHIIYPVLLQHREGVRCILKQF